MKIVVFGGGLGNQIFEYGFFLYLKTSLKDSEIHGIYNTRWLKEHNGLEIDKVFDVELPRQSLKAFLVASVLFLLKRMRLSAKRVDMATRTVNFDAIVYNGCKADKAYLPEGVDWLRFNPVTLNAENCQVLQKIEMLNSVFVHVRRGDYLSEKYKRLFEGTCPLSYYQSAFTLICKRMKDPVFFIFSDDVEWVRKNLSLPSTAIYVVWNTDENSYIDMYLMSNCKAAIIANSTFSFWGAKLGNRKKIVTYPAKWINTPEGAPNIFPDYWIKL